MQRPSVSPATGQQINPKHRIPLDRTERHAPLPLLVAIHKLAPPLAVLLIRRRIHHRKPRPPAHRPVLNLDIREKTRLSISPRLRAGQGPVRVPVRVEVEVLSLAVADELDRLEPGPREVQQALEPQGAVLDARYDFVGSRRDARRLRRADALVERTGAGYG